METEPRKKWSAREKLEIVLEGIQNPEGIAEVCRKYGVNTTSYYLWRDRLFKSADKVFEHGNNDRRSNREEILEGELHKAKEVIAEITTENLELKKTPGKWRTIRDR